VSYRKPYPEEEIIQEVMEKLQENNIDANQLEAWKPDKC
jgi:hypothetical protein